MTVNGLIRAAHALHYLERRQEVAAHNLANASTTGFKAERVFGRAIGDALPAADTATDFRAGTLVPTGNPLDLALEGDAFLVVETPNGERLSRGGSFRLDEQGRLADQSGNLLLGRDGAIRPGPGTHRHRRARRGARRRRSRSACCGWSAPRSAKRCSTTPERYSSPVRRAAAASPTGSTPLRQGTLEDSNVDSIGAMVDMISIQRAYAAVQKAVVTLDGIRGTVTNDLAKPI
jgi:flagellar basal-body rod protein FlgF